MNERKYCLDCALLTPRQSTIATRMVDGDPMCDVHANGAGKLIGGFDGAPRVFTPRLCMHGCGKPVHRGRCSASFVERRAAVQEPVKPQVPAAAPAVSSARKGKRMDELVAVVIKASEVPDCAPVIVRTTGRIGQLAERFMELGDGEALAVKCRDRTHCGSTDREFRAKAVKLGLAVETRRGGTTLFVWKGNGAA